MSDMQTIEGKIRSFLVLRPRDDDYDALIAFFKANDVLGKAIRYAGAYACEVHIPVARTGPVVVTAIWDSAEAYAGWRNHPIRDEMAPGMAQVIADTPEALTVPGGVFEIAVAATRE
jgi:heme-degrading monooxygenase HmoA